ncbi:MAG TPA: L-seryl-tRNA(Sec) selenium transferase [Thermoanaerobaculia bacterium]|nr:L-seryl-tRNA(Sec) selenium transferase [Thermoanaerobaculia bacterium]
MASRQPADLRRELPAVDRVLGLPEVRDLVRLYGRALVAVQVREELAALRRAPDEVPAALEELPRRLERRLEAVLGGRLGRVLNATGIFLHTHLGRAPLPPQVAAQLPPLVDASCDLELDRASGRRGERNRRAEALLRQLTGAPAALVTNNNAAALLLALATLAQGREVVVSRGELVEIGGSFRIPEVLSAAGARLVEVGTTNRTRLADYARAIGPQTALLLKVHPSNYRIRGFTAAVAAGELVELGRRQGLPVVVDEGAGLLRPRREPQLRDHPSLAELVAAGVALASGSGDKVAGGPQAGLLVGEAALVAQCRRHPLYRALRPGRLTYAALEGVLLRHLREEPLPIDRLWPDPVAHRQRVAAMARRLDGEVVAAEAFLGGGAAPDAPIPGEAVALPDADGELARRLRLGEPAVFGYVVEGRLLLDLRTVAPEDDAALAAAVARARQPSGDG